MIGLIKAKIFMGDTGSLVSGFVIAVLSIKFMELQAVPAAPATAVAILFIPVFDTLRVFAIRISGGRSPFSPDKNHLHHRFLRLGLPQIMVVTLMLMINLGMIIITIAFAEWGSTVLLLTQVGIAFAISVL